MKLPPDVEFHEDIRLFVHRPRDLLNEAVDSAPATITALMPQPRSVSYEWKTQKKPRQQSKIDFAAMN